MSGLTVDSLSFSYDGKRKILDNVSLEAQPGQALVLAGYSGCGKSTLCLCMSGVIPNAVKGHLEGRVTADGFDVTASPLCECARHVGLVFQNPDDMLVCSAVEDELAFGLENLCVEPGEIRRRVDEMLEKFDLAPLALRDPARLSGGQQKRVSIAAVLIMGPQVIILDEPMTGLDAQSRELVFSAIDLLKRAGRTVIAVEHDLSLAGYADKIMYLREGRLYDSP